jgi:hypothetical protein
MSNVTTSLLFKAMFLKAHPEAEDAIHPHGARLSQRFVEQMAAGVVRDIALQVGDKAVQKRLHEIGRQMAGSASRGVVQGYDEGDDLCPPPLHWPWPGPRWFGQQFGPQPEPWKVSLVDQLILADLLMTVATVTTHEEFSTQLKNSSIEIVKGAAGKLVEAFERSDVTPRPS